MLRAKLIILLFSLLIKNFEAQNSCPFPSCSSYISLVGCIVECTANENSSFPEPGEKNEINTLILSGFSSIPDNAFNNLQVSKVEIDASQLTSISDSAFNGVSGLVSLTFKNLNNANLIKNSFLQSLNLNFFGVTNSFLTNESIINIISELKSLGEISFAGNNLTYVNLTLDQEINTLNFEQNLLSNIYLEGKVRRLILDSNEIESTSNIDLSKVTSIESISLNYNRLEYLSTNLFNSKDFKNISFAFNSINQIDSNAFTSMVSLQSVDLSGNSLTGMSLNFPSGISSLILDNCELGNFSTSDLGVSSISEISLAYNKIAKLPEDFSQIVRNAIYINLMGNYLQDVSFLQEQRYNNLLALNLAGNKISSLSQVYLENISNLNQLTLVNNLIEQVEFGSLNNLRILELNFNRIKRINQSSFGRLENLISLDLSNNLLEEIEVESFANNKNLLELKLNGNYLKTIPDISELSSLSLLSMEFQNRRLGKIENFAFDRKLAGNGQNTVLNIKLYENYIQRIGDNAFCNRLGKSLDNNQVYLEINNINQINKCMLAQFKTSMVQINTKRNVFCFIEAYGTKYNITFESQQPSNCVDLSIRKDLCSRRKRYICPSVLQ